MVERVALNALQGADRGPTASALRATRSTSGYATLKAGEWVERDLRGALGPAADGHETLRAFRYSNHRMRWDRRAMTVRVSRLFWGE